MKSNKLSNFMKKDFNIVAKAKYFIIPPIAIFLIGLIVLCFCGFNLGLDFTGGSVISIEFREEVTSSQYNEKVDVIKSVLSDNGVKKYTLQKAGDDSTPIVSIKFQDVNNVNMEEFTEELRLEFSSKLNFDEDQITNSGRIGASASSKLITNAFLSVGLATLFILIYIAIRFELFSGISAVLTLLHDVIIMIALTVIFRIQINSSFIAAIITIVGYSINNTIVIFDRIRENIRKETYATYSNRQIVDVSIKETITRSIYTATTTLLAVVCLAVIGVSDIREFIIPIIFGLIAGTYSSVLLAPSLWSILYKKDRDKRLQRLKEKKEKLDETAVEEKQTEDVANS